MLEYVALGILVFVFLTFFYGIIVIHDIPYEIAKKRNHPQQDALHVAGWVSLFTLHVMWPFLWIWATLYREDRGWGFNHKTADNQHNENSAQLIKLQNRVEALEALIHQQEKKMHDVEEMVEHPDPTISHTFNDIEKSIIAEQEGNK